MDRINGAWHIITGIFSRRVLTARCRADRRLVCRSDADSQLLLYIPFNQTVKLTGVIFDGPADEHPTLARIFVNSTPIGFEEAEEAEPAQVGAGLKTLAEFNVCAVLVKVSSNASQPSLIWLLLPSSSGVGLEVVRLWGERQGGQAQARPV